MANDPDALPESFDVILLGTGLCESILAAAFSRVGYSVLHLDKHTYYGELEATHSLNGLLNYSQLHADGLPAAAAPSCLEDEQSISLPAGCDSALSNITYQYYNVSEDERSRYMHVLESARRLQAEKNSKSDSSSEKPEGDDEAVSDSLPADDGDAPGTQAINETGPEAIAAEYVAPLNPVVQSYLAACAEADAESVHKLACLKAKSNRFILDLSPKLLFARSDMIDLLITSDVARYCEFRSITQILTINSDNCLQVVPCSRSDIFASKTLSMIEKRLLMKLLTLCMSYETSSAYEAFAEKPFIEFLKSQNLTPNLINYVVNAIAMVPRSSTTRQGLEQTRRFLTSLGRYGHTPFLWPLYGGEINQAFCRMSAVFGGVYILHRTVSHIIVNQSENRVSSVLCNEGSRISCKWLICNASYMGDHVGPQAKYLSRAIVVTSGSLSTNTDKEQAVLLSVPSLNASGDPVTVIELGAAACVCPRDVPNLRVVHFTTRGRSTAQADLEVYVEKLFSRHEVAGKPRLLLACYFNLPDYGAGARLTTHPDNLYITPGPDASISPDNSVVKAKGIFTTVCPGEEFLPRPPDPEDIIYCDDESKKESAGESFASEANETGPVKKTEEVNETNPVKTTEEVNETETVKTTEEVNETETVKTTEEVNETETVKTTEEVNETNIPAAADVSDE